jgi:Methyltransferase domain
MSFEAQLESLDLKLFESIESQSTPEDRRSLLALQVACRREHESFEWLEIGSHLGGSLQTLVRDPRCARIHSIDPRPNEVPSERMNAFTYPQNSTERMLELLGSIPEANVGILRTYDISTDVLDPKGFNPPHVCYIDGEHTNEACEKDAEFCRRTVGDEGVICFHDVDMVYEAVTTFIDRLNADGTPHRVAYLPDFLFAVELGPRKLLEDPVVVGRRLEVGPSLLRVLNRNDRFRALLKARRAQVLRWLRVLPREY